MDIPVPRLLLRPLLESSANFRLEHLELDCQVRHGVIRLVQTGCHGAEVGVDVVGESSPVHLILQVVGLDVKGSGGIVGLGCTVNSRETVSFRNTVGSGETVKLGSTVGLKNTANSGDVAKLGSTVGLEGAFKSGCTVGFGETVELGSTVGLKGAVGLGCTVHRRLGIIPRLLVGGGHVLQENVVVVGHRLVGFGGLSGDVRVAVGRRGGLLGDPGHLNSCDWRRLLHGLVRGDVQAVDLGSRWRWGRLRAGSSLRAVCIPPPLTAVTHWARGCCQWSAGLPLAEKRCRCRVFGLLEVGKVGLLRVGTLGLLGTRKLLLRVGVVGVVWLRVWDLGLPWVCVRGCPRGRCWEGWWCGEGLWVVGCWEGA